MHLETVNAHRFPVRRNPSKVFGCRELAKALGGVGKIASAIVTRPAWTQNCFLPSVRCPKLLLLASDKPTRSQRCEHIGSSQCAEAFPDVRPCHLAAGQLQEMPSGKINVHEGDEQRRERVQHEGGQRKLERLDVRRFHLNNSTLANGSADQGRKRLRVNFVGCPGVTSTWTKL